MRARIQSFRHDERGFALILAIALMTLITTASLVVMTLTQGENSKSRRDQAQDGAYQAAEAGTNAYLANMTQDIGFYNTEVAKGEATRTGSIDHVAHPNNCTVTCNDMTWNPAWGTTWTYPTTQAARAADTGWYTVDTPGAGVNQEYQYLIQVYPPNINLAQNEAQLITRIDVTGRPYNSTDYTKWKTIETLLRPSSLADFQAFLATSETYGTSAVTTGPIFVGEDNSVPPVKGNLTHNGTAKANLYAEGTVGGTTTYQNGATHYDKNTTPNALCKLNNCSPVPFTTFTNYIGTVKSAAQSTGGIVLPTTDPNNANLVSPWNVDVWQLTFNSNGTVTAKPCKDQTGVADYTGTTAPQCFVAKNAPFGNGVTASNISTLSPAKFPIYSNTDVIVQGTVHGTVTVASADDIIYGGNTNYVLDGADVLGLEATNNIYIPEWAVHSAASAGNITVYSAQFSLNGAFTADPNCTWTGGSNPAGYSTCDASSTTCNPANTCTMTINGSSALYGGPNGPILMTNLFSDRNYNYDNNLLFLPPPYFPTLPNAFTILVQRQI